MRRILTVPGLLFQSSPTPKGGRYFSQEKDPLRYGFVRRIVSILAHPERWALQLPKTYIADPKMFQSSPTPKGGRYGFIAQGRSRCSMFQSSPTPKGGRYYAV